MEITDLFSLLCCGKPKRRRRWLRLRRTRRQTVQKRKSYAIFGWRGEVGSGLRVIVESASTRLWRGAGGVEAAVINWCRGRRDRPVGPSRSRPPPPPPSGMGEVSGRRCRGGDGLVAPRLRKARCRREVFYSSSSGCRPAARPRSLRSPYHQRPTPSKATTYGILYTVLL